jgi:hypothetical protein
VDAVPVINTAREIWATRLEQIERALVQGLDPMPISGVTEMLEQGNAQAWFADNSTAVTTLVERGDTRVCEIWLAGGELAELVDMKNSDIEPWAKNMGASRMLIIGRKGWEKALPDYRYAHTSLVKELI